MDKYNKSQILKLSLIAALLVLAPLLSSSLRSTYLYFILNLLIITLGAEAGLLSFFSKSPEDRKPVVIVPPKAPVIALEVTHDKEGSPLSAPRTVNPECTPKNAKEGLPLSILGTVSPNYTQKKAKVVEKCSSEKIVAVRVLKVKKCPSTPSLFFIGGGEADGEEVHEDYNEEVEGEEIRVPSEQELFHKAETFIGNFYKQLKMQREESWKRIHGLYNKAF